ncbi:hypothetical protein GQ44DRAFT_795174 [Phaeosphaeriaceae sp. PMI808]|nr:hypothetical protein GQ44DRAFT_795174 [Phaeosphaeriaceae sp. PMI808]
MSLSFCYATKLTQVKVLQNLSAPLQDKDRKWKRAQEPGEPPTCAPTRRLRKRSRISVAHSAFGDTFGQPTIDGVSDNKINPIDYWTEKQRWPKKYFEQDYQTKNNMNHLLVRKKSSSSLRDKSSEARSTGSSDQKLRDVKSAPYLDARYETLLATKGSFMGKSELGTTATSKSLCQTLLQTKQTFPDDSLFHDDLFEETCEMVRNKNEAKVVRDISPLIVPSVEILAVRGAKHLKILIESVNEGWNNSIPITKTRPQPDYSVAFRRGAFTEEQLKRIEPFCGAAALDIADRQNVHSMTMAVRGIVELFRLVKREKELHQEILAFSISHDHSMVRIYGHYPVIDGNKTTFYRHPIRKFDFTELDGKDKWTSYQFTKNIYDIWMPTHLKRICSVIDGLPPNIDFGVSQHGLSQELESHHLSDQTSYDTSSLEEANSQSNRVGSRDVTPDTSLSQRIEGEAFQKPRKRGRPTELHQ